MLKIITPTPNKSAYGERRASMEEWQLNMIDDIKRMENSKAFINEKKYYIKLIELLGKLGYYKNGLTLKNLWSKK